MFDKPVLIDPACLLALLRNQKPKQASPYLNAEQAADYLQITNKALYALVEKNRLKPLPGHRHYRFTTEILDNFLKGE